MEIGQADVWRGGRHSDHVKVLMLWVGASRMAAQLQIRSDDEKLGVGYAFYCTLYCSAGNMNITVCSAKP